MAYYRGDYYRGDGNYYRGDPFIGGLIAGAAGKLVKKGVQWVGRQTVGGLIGKTAAAGAAAAAAPAVARRVAQTQVTIRPSEIMPGGEEFIDFGPMRKKYRKMNPLNPKALRRALRRAEGFEKFAKRTMSALVKPGGGRKFKRTTKRR